MFISIVYLCCGAALLYLGANWLVKSGINIAQKFHVSALVIGLTVIAFGTSLPELVISIHAVLMGSPTIAIGNVVGSNVANVGLVLGLSSLIFPISIHFQKVKRDLFIYLGVCVIFILFALNGIFSRLEGVLLFSGLILYTWIRIIHPTSKDPNTDKSQIKLSTIVGLFLVGVWALYYGSKLFVNGAVEISRLLGISEVVIGMTIVALGTSIPELATSTVAAFKRQSAISVGNIIGSNLFNILSVIGLVSIIKPLIVPPEILLFEVPVMIVFGVVLIPAGLFKQPLSRVFSVGLILGYCYFIFELFN
ncbi:MAG: calcium/sodium antiporter [Candidatus Neomarinimicrobiota bacterium]